MDSTCVTEPVLYSSLGDDPELHELLALFVDELPGRIARMEMNLRGSDWDSLRQAAHQLKGAAGSYGFEPISIVSAALERRAAEGHPEREIKLALDELRRLCQHARPSKGG